MLGFSSADITNSSGPKAVPSQLRAYRSSTRPAFSAKWGSRGKIQLRWRQGGNASALSQRQSVTPLICATIPRAITSRWSSGTVKCASGTPWREGISQASRLTSTTTLGGEAGWAPAAGLFVQPGEAFEEEPVPPLADDLPRRIEAGGDDVVPDVLGGEQDDLGANHVTIR